MRLVGWLGVLLVVIGAFGVAGSLLSESRLAGQAELVQRLEPYDAATAELTGEPGTPIGEPEMMIIADERAFLKQRGDQGQRLVDDAYLRRHGVYPIQLKTVRFVGNLIRLTSYAAAGLGVLAILLARWRRGRVARPV